MKIDFVIPWVDGSDPVWRAEKAKYEPKTVDQDKSGDSRYRDWDNLQYWFRAVEKNAPWVNKIFFITCGQVPDFLNLDHPKLCFVKHQDYIPEQYLPTFSSRTIEIHLHRIKGLSEHFVYFNDDFFINQPVNEDFFFTDGKPRYLMVDRPYDDRELTNSYQRMRRNGMEIINRHFTRKDLQAAGWDKIVNPLYGRANLKNLLVHLTQDHFLQFQDLHLPESFLKSTFEEVWAAEGEILEKASRNRIRAEDGVNQYVFRYWDLARGNFVPRGVHGTRYNVRLSCLNQCVRDISDAKSPSICINDSPECDDFDTCKMKILEAFQKRYPEKSSFEL